MSMDIISEQVYLPSYRRRRSPRSTAAMLIGCASLVYFLEARHNLLSSAWKSFSRFISLVRTAVHRCPASLSQVTLPKREVLRHCSGVFEQTNVQGFGGSRGSLD